MSPTPTPPVIKWPNLARIDEHSIVQSTTDNDNYYIDSKTRKQKEVIVVPMTYHIAPKILTDQDLLNYFGDYFTKVNASLESAMESVRPAVSKLEKYLRDNNGQKKQ